MSVLDGLLVRLRSRRPRPDGTAPGLQHQAVVEGALSARRLSIEGHRPVDLIEEKLAAKTLEGWIANRHQTLFPLAINFRRLGAAETDILVSMLAVALMAAGETPEPGLSTLRGWLRTVGGDEALAASVEARLEAPPPLVSLLLQVEQARLAPYAYSVSLAAIDQRILANRLFLDYLAARLAIPSDMARSLAQRFRS